MPDKTIYLKDYQEATFGLDSVSLNVDLYDDHVLITSQLKLIRYHPGPLTLYGDNLTLISLKLNDKILSAEHYRFEAQDLVIDDCPDVATLEVITKIEPQNNTELSGLYRSNGLFCTQCEAEGFRRITYFLDRPDVLTIYTTRISAEKQKYPVLLSNGNLIAKGEEKEGRHWVVWQDPFKKPSYLFALVAGNLVSLDSHFTTCSNRVVDLRIFVEPGNEDNCHHAMDSLKAAMKWDEEIYGREYDLDIFMIVAVSDFNMGAMENKGLNIFNSKYILASPKTATDQDFADVEGVVAHEYFHNWTGNRITCRDWFQLSLKEGLTVFRDQEFSRDMNGRDVNRISDVKVLRNGQFPEDAGSMAHPVRPESYQEINNFYTATIYNKGAEVIRMQQILLGETGFRRGMDLYFERHDGQAVTIDDFVAAMADANQVDLIQFKRWYSQAGTPEIAIDTRYENGTLTLTLTQTCPPTPEIATKLPFHIPLKLAFFSQNGEQLSGYPELIELKEARTTFQWEGFSEQPIVSLNRGFSAPVKLNGGYSQQSLLALLQYETDGFSKWDAAIQLALMVMAAWIEKPAAEWEVPEAVLNAYRVALLDTRLDNALKAELLTLPGFEEVAALKPCVDVDWVEAARQCYRVILGKYLATDLLAVYQALQADVSDALNAKAYGCRKLKNSCLSLLMKANEAERIADCWQQYTNALTMTDQLASFTLLAHSHDADTRQKAITAFYQQWQDNELVIDKWFAIQASADLPQTLAHVKSLLSHPAFSYTNPNKVRAVVGAFTQANPRQFHALDGSGYQFLTKILLKMDKINPQIAARLATPFSRWHQLDNKRQDLIQNSLKQLMTHDLSRDLAEVVSKSMAV